MKKKNYLSLLSKLFLIIILLIIYIPIILVIIYSFNDSKYMGNWSGFSLKWYISLLNNRYLINSVLFTLFICFSSVIISIFIGLLFSISSYLSSVKKYKKRILMSINQLTLITPDIILGISYMLLFLNLNLTFSWKTVLLSHILFNVPIVLIIISLNLKKINKNIILSAQDLGANTIQTIIYAIIPQLKKSIITCFIICISFSLDDFIITYFTSGEGTTTLSVEILTQIRRQISPEINALYSIIILIIFLIVLLYISTNKNKRKKKNLIEDFGNIK